MITIFAEKPDVARKIAAALGPIYLDNGTEVKYKDINKFEKQIKAIQTKYGYIPIKFKGEECAVTHGYGHLCGLWELKDYDESFKQWYSIPLPYIPKHYNIKVSPSTSKQFEIVKNLFNKSEYIINATDWDREGEVIFSYVYEAAECKIPFKRAYYNSQNEEAFINSFNDLRESSEVRNLGLAGRCRGVADWLIGMNLTVAASLKAKGMGVMSIGRVQTPTLNMVVEREKAIRNFNSEKYYTVSAEFTTETGEIYSGEQKTKYASPEEAQELISKLSGNAVVKSVESKTEKVSQPSLYSLSILQMDANSKFGFTADQTLKIVQELYEAGVVTYPRTNSAFLPEDYMPQTDRALKALETLPAYKHLLEGKARNYNKKYFDSKKVESHFAIVPTHVVGSDLTGEKAKIYDLICKSLIMLIYPAAEKENMKVITADGDTEFTSKGTRIVKKGWMEVAGVPDDKLLPNLTSGQNVSAEYKANEKNTEPPKRYTDKTLIAAMMSADKDADNKDIMSLAELNIAGIGQESTRASIIENLVSRCYIERKKKSFYATDKGITLIDSLPVSELKSAQLTAMWETRLNNVSNGTENYVKFVRDIEQTTREWCSIIKRMMKPIIAPPVEEKTNTKHIESKEKEELTCPICKSVLKKNENGYYCSFEDKFTVNYNLAGKKLTENQIYSLLTKGSTSVIKGFVSKSGRKFDAKLVLDENYKIVPKDAKYQD